MVLRIPFFIIDLKDGLNGLYLLQKIDSFHRRQSCKDTSTSISCVLDGGNW